MAAHQANHALVVGASSGIGRAVAHEVAPLVNKLTLASRSLPDDLIPSIKERNPSIDVTHEKLDVSSLRDVRRFTDAYKADQSSVPFDWIVMSPGIMNMNGRTETPEGLDVKMATHYYGRFMLIHDLLPTLDRPNVRVLNIFSAASGSAVDVTDLDLKRTYSVKRCADFTTQYSDLMAQAFAEHAPNASFMHAYPGWVDTGLSKGLPWYMRTLGSPLVALFARSPEKCAKHLTTALTNPEFATGWKLLGQNAEVLKPTKYHTEELKDIVWKHSEETIDRALQQGTTTT